MHWRLVSVITVARQTAVRPAKHAKAVRRARAARAAKAVRRARAARAARNASYVR